MPACCSSTGAGRTWSRRARWTSRSSCAGSTSRPRSCPRCARSSPTGPASIRRRGTRTSNARRERRSSRHTRGGSCRPPGRTRWRPACAPCSRTTRSRSCREVEAPITALIAADDEVGSRAAALTDVSAARVTAGRGPIAVRAFPHVGHNLMRYRPDEVTAAILGFERRWRSLRSRDAGCLFGRPPAPRHHPRDDPRRGDPRLRGRRAGGAHPRGARCRRRLRACGAHGARPWPHPGGP